MSNPILSSLGYSQAPNYCTHALEAFAELREELPRKLGLPNDLESLLCSLLTDAIKFLLPDNGYLFEKHDFKPGMFDLLRLPYPICALEFPATKELHAEQSGLSHASKRIALCFDPHQLNATQLRHLDNLCSGSFLAEAPEQCLAVMAVYEAEGVWGASVGTLLLDLVNDRPMLRKDASPSDLCHEVAEQIGPRVHEGSTYGLPVTFKAFFGRARMLGQSAEEATRNLYIDTIDEIRTAFEFLAAINCSNVGTQDIAAPKMLNEKRKKKGKPLFYPYKVLDLSLPKAAGAPTGANGTHASPRAHLRRGHVRQLGAQHGNKVLWINATMVNARTGHEPVTTVYKVKT
ncbi:hypothetical protein P5X00_37075 [Paraburkholderia sp. A2RO-4L]|uniref:hypothetical protein n=1 Tax=Paraburkholderia sp. A2RO-4L TaxID=3028374 RepID=UPI003DA81076